jgi:hypothetical protein
MDNDKGDVPAWFTTGLAGIHDRARVIIANHMANYNVSELNAGSHFISRPGAF